MAGSGEVWATNRPIFSSLALLALEEARQNLHVSACCSGVLRRPRDTRARQERGQRLHVPLLRLLLLLSPTRAGGISAEVLPV